MLTDIYESPHDIILRNDKTCVQMTKQSADRWTHEDTEITIDTGIIYVTATRSKLENIELIWHHNIQKPVSILGDQWERGYGDFEWRGIQYDRIMPWYMLINDGCETIGYGVKTDANSFCFWRFCNNKMSLTVDLRCGGYGVELGGRLLRAAQLTSSRSTEDPFLVAHNFCKTMCDNPILPKMPIYGGNDWYCNYGNNSHEKIMIHARKIAKWSQGFSNRPFMVVDDGWQICHGHTLSGQTFNGGPWNRGNYKFPCMAGLAAEIKELDVRPGIWYRPLFTAEKMPEGSLLARTTVDNFLDPSSDAVLCKVQEDIQRFVKWGYELIKHDFTTFDMFGKWGFQMSGGMTDSGWGFVDRSKTSAEIIRNFYSVIREAAGDIHIIGCNTLSHLSAGFFDIQRTGDDTSGKEWNRTRKMGINTLAFRMPQHNAFYASDADCVGITKDVPWKLNRKWLEILSKSGTPLFISVEDFMLEEQQEMDIVSAFKYASKNTSVAQPLDWMYNSSPAIWMIDGEIHTFNWDDISEP